MERLKENAWFRLAKKYAFALSAQCSEEMLASFAGEGLYVFKVFNDDLVLLPDLLPDLIRFSVPGIDFDYSEYKATATEPRDPVLRPEEILRYREVAEDTPAENGIFVLNDSDFDEIV